MDRRNFLALIPSISAIPFIGKNIEKTSEKIVIYQPEQVKDFVPKPKYLRKAELIVVIDGEEVARTNYFDADIEYRIVDRRFSSYYTGQELRLTARFHNFNFLNKLT